MFILFLFEHMLYIIYQKVVNIIQAAARDMQRDSALRLTARSPCAAFLSMAASRAARVASSFAAFLSMMSCLKDRRSLFKVNKSIKQIIQLNEHFIEELQRVINSRIN